MFNFCIYPYNLKIYGPRLQNVFRDKSIIRWANNANIICRFMADMAFRGNLRCTYLCEYSFPRRSAKMKDDIWILNITHWNYYHTPHMSVYCICIRYVIIFIHLKRTPTHFHPLFARIIHDTYYMLRIPILRNTVFLFSKTTENLQRHTFIWIILFEYQNDELRVT